MNGEDYLCQCNLKVINIILYKLDNSINTTFTVEAHHKETQKQIETPSSLRPVSWSEIFRPLH